MANNPLHLGLIVSAPFHQHGGINEHTLSLGKELKKLGNRVTFISPSPKNKFFPQPHLRFGHALKVPTPHGSWANFTYTSQSLSKIRTQLIKSGINLLHFQELTYPVMSWQILFASPLKNIATFHSGWNLTDHKPIFQSINTFQSNKLFSNKLSGSICVSQTSLRCNAPLPSPNNIIIPPLTDFSPLNSPLPRPVELKPDKLNLLFVGRFDSRKGLPHLLKAMKSLPKKILNQLHLHVIGSGPQKILAKLAQNGLSSHLTLHGKLSRLDKFAFYQHSDLFIAPSTHGESFGMILVEAMAAGLPLIAGNNDGYRETLQDYPDQSLILDPTDTPRFAEALTKLINSPKLRKALSTFGKQEVKKYLPAKLAKRHLDYYQEILSNSEK